MQNTFRMLSLTLFLLVTVVGCSEKRSVAPETTPESGAAASTPEPAAEESRPLN